MSLSLVNGKRELKRTSFSLVDSKREIKFMGLSLVNGKRELKLTSFSLVDNKREIMLVSRLLKRDKVGRQQKEIMFTCLSLVSVKERERSCYELLISLRQTRILDEPLFGS